VGSVAKALGLQSVTIRKWERLGRLPLSRYRAPAPKSEQVPGKTPKGRRLYTRHQIEVVITAADSAGVTDPEVRFPDWQKFTKIVVDGWKKSS
jgi:DNA-binding transcriptional MerR regulator